MERYKNSAIMPGTKIVANLLIGARSALAVDKVESVQRKLPVTRYMLAAGATTIRLHDPGPKVSVLNQEL